MYDQVYRYLDLPGQVCENTEIYFKTTVCDFSLLSFCTTVYVCVCVCCVSHAEVWVAGNAVCHWT